MAMFAYGWLTLLMLSGLFYFVYPLTDLLPIIRPLFWLSLLMFVGTVYLFKLQGKRLS